MYGSPPHVRGKETRQAGLLRAPGITPACAGKSNLFVFRRIEPKDHPRVCGEKLSDLFFCSIHSGSPPRMRGKEVKTLLHFNRVGITPAYAGKSRQALPAVLQTGDHPRVCGEKSGVAIRTSAFRGSPPRMRGKGSNAFRLEPAEGITPAYAGKRLKRSRSTVPPVAIVPLFPSVCNKPVVSDGSPAGRDAPLFLPAENAVPASPAYNLRSL